MRSTMLKTRALLCSVLIMTALATQPVRAATFHFLGGIQDNYTPPTETANPSASLQSWLGSNTYSPYDSTTINQRFAETFDKCPMCITGCKCRLGSSH